MLGLVLGKFGWFGLGPILLDQRLDGPVPDKISGTGTGTARDRLYQSGPGPDWVQTWTGMFSATGAAPVAYWGSSVH